MIGDGDELIVRRGIQNDDRRFQAQQRVDRLQRRRIRQMLRHNGIDVLGVKQRGGAVKFLVRAAQIRRAHDLQSLRLKQGDKAVRIRKQRRAVLPAVVIELDIQRQIPNFDLSHKIPPCCPLCALRRG